MHPLISAWLTYVYRLNEQPKWDTVEWPIWLEDCVALERWWYELRKRTY